MEMRYDPMSDTTEYTETFRATCPVCGREQAAAVSIPAVPRSDVDPSVICALDGLAADHLARARALFLAHLPPCGTCSPEV